VVRETCGGGWVGGCIHTCMCVCMCARGCVRAHACVYVHVCVCQKHRLTNAGRHRWHCHLCQEATPDPKGFQEAGACTGLEVQAEAHCVTRVATSASKATEAAATRKAEEITTARNAQEAHAHEAHASRHASGVLLSAGPFNLTQQKGNRFVENLQSTALGEPRLVPLPVCLVDADNREATVRPSLSCHDNIGHVTTSEEPQHVGDTPTNCTHEVECVSSLTMSSSSESCSCSAMSSSSESRSCSATLQHLEPDKNKCKSDTHTPLPVKASTNPHLPTPHTELGSKTEAPLFQSPAGVSLAVSHAESLAHLLVACSACQAIVPNCWRVCICVCV